MKTTTRLLFFVMITSGGLNIKAENLKMARTENCFSTLNLSIVHSYIKNQSIRNKNSFFEFEGYELYAEENLQIALKDKGYTLARINRENGIYSLAILKISNDRIVKKTGEIFCSILKIAVENK
jgi:hypothetical protein